MDRLLMENYLLLLKSTTEVYVHGTLESSNQDIRLVLKDCLNEIISSQNETYDLMASKNWYNVLNVDNTVINKTLTKLENASS